MPVINGSIVKVDRWGHTMPYYAIPDHTMPYFALLRVVIADTDDNNSVLAGVPSDAF